MSGKSLVIWSLSLAMLCEFLATTAQGEVVQLDSSQIIRQTRLASGTSPVACFVKDGAYRVGLLKTRGSGNRRAVDTFTSAELYAELGSLEKRVRAAGVKSLNRAQHAKYRFLKRSLGSIVDFERQCAKAPESSPTATPTPDDAKHPEAPGSLKEFILGKSTQTGGTGGEGGVDTVSITITGTRPSCVAPCAIFAEVSAPSVVGGERDASYLINFDTTGVDPGNQHSVERQRLAAHVYSVPGTYQISAAIRGVFGDTGSSAPVSVTIHDPNVVYNPANGGRTICVTTTANPGFANCPVGAQQVVSNSLWQVFETYLAPISTSQAQVPTRLMLKEGSVWTSDALWWASGNVSQALITSFPNPSNPVRPKFFANSPYPTSDILILKGSNITVENLHIEGNFTPQNASFSHSKAFHVQDTDNVLVRNTKIVGTGAQVAYLGDHAVRTVFADNDVRDIYGYGFYGSSNWTAVSRNLMRNAYSNSAHMIRIQDLDLDDDHLVINGNDFGYDTVLDGPNRSMTCITVRGFTRGVTLVGNTCERPITLAPQGTGFTEYIEDAVVDGNISRPAFGDASDGYIAFGCTAAGVTFRNNLIRNIGTGFSIPIHPTVPGCSGAIYNNTYVNTSNVAGGSHLFLNAEASIAPQFVFNNIYISLSSSNSSRAIRYPASSIGSLVSAFNIYYAPEQGAGWTMFDSLGSTATSFTLQQWQALGTLEVETQTQDPQLQAPAYVPSSMSPAVDRGIPVLAFDRVGTVRPRDGNGDTRVWTDIGAMER